MVSIQSYCSFSITVLAGQMTLLKYLLGMFDFWGGCVSLYQYSPALLVLHVICKIAPTVDLHD